jgi:hypothetical protein
MLLQMPQINPSSAVAVQPELVPGESFVWAGQPKTSVVFHKEDFLLIPFSLMWGGFAIFWEANVLGIWGAQAHTPWTFGVLCGIPFVLIGQYLIWGRFFYTAWLKRRTHYAVTNRRGYRRAGRLEAANDLSLTCQGSKFEWNWHSALQPTSVLGACPRLSRSRMLTPFTDWSPTYERARRQPSQLSEESPQLLSPRFWRNVAQRIYNAVTEHQLESSQKDLMSGNNRLTKT